MGAFSVAGGSARKFAEDLDVATAASERLTRQLERQKDAAEKAKKAHEESKRSAEEAREAADAVIVAGRHVERMGEGVRGIALDAAQTTAALMSMAQVVGQVTDSVHKGDAAVGEMLKKLDAVATANLDGGFINTVVNKFKEGIIDAGEMKRQLDAVFQAMSVINAQGEQFMGDITKQILDAQRALNALQGGIENLQEGAGAMDWGGAGPGAGAAPASGAPEGEQVASAFGGASGAGGNGSTWGRGSLVSSAIDAGAGGARAAERARILRLLEAEIRRIRR